MCMEEKDRWGNCTCGYKKGGGDDPIKILDKNNKFVVRRIQC